MIKVFLVEDEVVVRNGIKNGVDWESEGFDFVGEAGDGELAYPIIKEKAPDILITDIKMPFMDGLELSKAVKKDFPNIKIIILSGHNEFQYAKEAIQIGIVEYLLKPISSVKLLETVNVIAQKVRKEREEQVLSLAEVLDEGKKLDELVERYRMQLIAIMKDYPNMGYFGGIGKNVSRLCEVKDSYHESEKAFAKGFLEQENAILSEGATESLGSAQVVLQGLGSMEQNRKMIEKFMRSGVTGEVSQFIEMYFDAWDDKHLESVLLRQYVIIDSYITILAYAKDLGGNPDELEQACGSLQDISSRISSVENTKTYMTTLLTNMFVFREKLSEKNGSRVISKAKEYIAKQYMKESISLNDIAAHVNMSPSYFSTLFAKEEGKTFVEYLTEVRMDQVKELLMNSDMRTSEIGYQVGYKDAHYFSHIFKKTQGCSPKEYRVRGKV